MPASSSASGPKTFQRSLCRLSIAVCRPGQHTAGMATVSSAAAPGRAPSMRLCAQPAGSGRRSCGHRPGIRWSSRRPGGLKNTTLTSAVSLACPGCDACWLVACACLLPSAPDSWAPLASVCTARPAMACTNSIMETAKLTSSPSQCTNPGPQDSGVPASWSSCPQAGSTAHEHKGFACRTCSLPQPGSVQSTWQEHAHC